MCLVQVKAHEVRAVAMSALFREIQSIPAVLRAGTWKRSLNLYSGKSCDAPLTPLVLSLSWDTSAAPSSRYGLCLASFGFVRGFNFSDRLNNNSGYK
ncbi:hypothetical protein E2C01_049057 [Portunus trituberculatus]|uniref:Uncharacterized protein n=1 Tax=Portunus trituberculatus TaxID=210409 RepID=A0A5B7GC59_PORTR|nr:hypothetical protein [Portunus trituberculatus]